MDNSFSPTNSFEQTSPPQAINTEQVPSNTPLPQSQGITPEKGHKKPDPITIGIICAITGLVVGALAVFSITKLLEQPSEPCQKCNQSANASSATGDINFDFLKMEAASSNIIYSPLSVRNGLGLLSAGANGTTKTEIDSILGDTPIPKYNTIPSKLSLANAVFIRDTFQNEVLPSYIETVQTTYDGEVLYDSFKDSANMDNWVKDKTLGLIDSIGIQPSDELKMVLANALAIKMDWEHKFDEDDTTGQAFYKSDGTVIEATTMHNRTSADDVLYYTDEDITAISLPLTTESFDDLLDYYYKNPTATEIPDDLTTEDMNIDFVAIMPSDIDTYIKNVETKDIDGLINKMTSASEPKDGLLYYIPKFKYDYVLNFEDDLIALGMKTAFNNELADFSKMASAPLYVGQAVHKANIDFSEDGIKAAAVTAFAMEVGAMMVNEEPQPIVIKLDHPFLFVIRDADNGTIWFTGAVYGPNLWADDAADYETR